MVNMRNRSVCDGHHRGLRTVGGDHVVDDWIKPQDANGIVLFHRSLFLAAAAEPLVQLPNGDIGFDPARFRRRVLELTAVQGSA
jgi:hypothetical protein